jgi:hypothetical protein
LLPALALALVSTKMRQALADHQVKNERGRKVPHDQAAVLDSNWLAGLDLFAE